jgi:hypothetical protein
MLLILQVIIIISFIFVFSNFVLGSLTVMKVDLELDVDESEFKDWVLAKIGTYF